MEVWKKIQRDLPSRMTMARCSEWLWEANGEHVTIFVLFNYVRQGRAGQTQRAPKTGFQFTLQLPPTCPDSWAGRVEALIWTRTRSHLPACYGVSAQLHPLSASSKSRDIHASAVYVLSYCTKQRREILCPTTNSLIYKFDQNESWAVSDQEKSHHNCMLAASDSYVLLSISLSLGL